MARSIWADIPGFPKYQASTAGKIRSKYFWTWRVLIARPSKRGYMYVQLCVPGKRGSRNVSVHRLVALAFLGPRPAGMEVNHKDGNKANCAATNLEYGTRSHNQKHAFRTGLNCNPCGEEARHVRFTSAEVGRMKSLRQGGATLRAIADEFDTSEGYVSEIMAGKYRQNG